VRARRRSVCAVHQPGQAILDIPQQPGMQGLPGDPELGRHHDLRFTALDRQHGTVALLDNRQVDQSQSRPPITVHNRRWKESRSGPNVKDQLGPACQESAGTTQCSYLRV
jgi:hypothetical protein